MVIRGRIAAVIAPGERHSRKLAANAAEPAWHRQRKASPCIDPNARLVLLLRLWLLLLIWTVPAVTTGLALIASTRLTAPLAHWLCSVAKGGITHAGATL